jgi:signal transduction histidine kinase/CheY-like chemotaxis protein
MPPSADPVIRPRRRTRFGRWWLDASLRTKGLVAVAPPVIALLVLGTTSLILGAQIDQLVAATTTTTTSLAQIDRNLQLADQAETGLRGYAATNDPMFLQPYHSAIAQLTHLDNKNHTIDGLTASQSATIRKVGTAAFLRLAATEAGIANHSFTPSQLDAALVQGNTEMDRIRAAISTDQASQRAVLAQHLQQLTSTEGAVRAVDLAALVLGIVAGVMAMVLLLRNVARRIRDVSRNTESFLDNQPIEPLEQSKDEVGTLQAVLLRASSLLTERGRELQISRDEAVAATLAKDQFLSRMSHELRTPLTAVLGFGQLLQMEELSPDDAESVNHIVGAGEHLLALINDVLDISRIEAGDISLSKEPILLRPAVSDAVTLMRPLTEARGITVSLAVAESVVVYADRQRLKQVLLNLISNAIKYNRQDGTIVISCVQRAGSRVALSVADTGVGIPASSLGRLFEPFERLGAEDTEVEGTGVGLSLSKALMEAMDGTIAASSQAGAGSTFTVTLPTGVLTDHVGSPDRDPTPLPAGPAGIVLYAEDNLASLRVVERIFTKRHESLKVTMEGRFVLELARDLQPRMVILDLHLPDIDGEHVLRQLKADAATADIPVVILSADATPGRLDRLVDQGASAYLTKPLVINDLLTLLDELAPNVQAT